MLSAIIKKISKKIWDELQDICCEDSIKIIGYIFSFSLEGVAKKFKFFYFISFRYFIGLLVYDQYILLMVTTIWVHCVWSFFVLFWYLIFPCQGVIWYFFVCTVISWSPKCSSVMCEYKCRMLVSWLFSRSSTGLWNLPFKWSDFSINLFAMWLKDICFTNYW